MEPKEKNFSGLDLFCVGAIMLVFTFMFFGWSNSKQREMDAQAALQAQNARELGMWQGATMVRPSR